MKKIILNTRLSHVAYLLLVAVIFCGCTSIDGDKIEETDKNYTIKEIDSCEYIECDYGIFDQRVYSLTHKGNCKFCAERSKK